MLNFEKNREENTLITYAIYGREKTPRTPDKEDKEDVNICNSLPDIYECGKNIPVKV